MSGPLAWLVGFVTDPRWGIPTLFLLEATAFWFAWNPRDPLVGAGRRVSWIYPDADPVSRMFYALGLGRFSSIVRWSRDRVEELYEFRNGEALSALPWRLRWWGPQDPRYGHRRVVRELREIEWEALERESGTRPRWAFWRTAARDASVYRNRVERLLTRANASIATLEGPA